VTETKPLGRKGDKIITSVDFGRTGKIMQVERQRKKNGKNIGEAEIYHFRVSY